MDLSSGLYDGAPDVKWDGTTIPFSEHSFQSALATEVLEHCANPQKVLNEINRILKPGGFFFFSVPFMWPLHDMPHDEYRYTPTALTRHLEEAGFCQISIKATGGWDASLSQMIALWVRNRPMATWKRTALSIVAEPFVRFLARRDRPPASFIQYVMVPGFVGTAIKR
jgi:SAM-dependent methyltransferase